MFICGEFKPQLELVSGTIASTTIGGKIKTETFNQSIDEWGDKKKTETNEKF